MVQLYVQGNESGTMTKELLIFHRCLYFTANTLGRVIARMAEEEFVVTGISPSYAYLMMLVYENPGIIQKDMADQMHLAPSTVTRFVSQLVHKGHLEKRGEGRTSRIYPTESGLALKPAIDAAWHALYERYNALLGKEVAQQLTQLIDEANRTLMS
jgi:DNA-binding MarR family transcriptional regulator